ncbi:glucuronate isomerase [uncultured Tateyamaria sp.]|uniref:glucuronate isomerase n=1 Tax=uncultured Tateyamaria sp. TaxID=455651 RepID=UPI00262F880C|nr:glucuronate isomerase [uncultured Tateyamaria sp.]
MALELTGKAAEIYDGIRHAPIVSPHGHCDPAWFAENQPFADPAELLVIPDHYVFRMLYSQGVPLEKLGVGVSAEDRNPRQVFRLFAAHWHLFLGTPSQLWIEYVLRETLSCALPLGVDTADAIYDHIEAWLADPANRPRALFDRFGIEVLATTDAALDPLSHHKEIANSEWDGRMVPTFRPDALLNPRAHGWASGIASLGAITNQDTSSYYGFVAALRQRRAMFKSLGATATDHAIEVPQTVWLDNPADTYGALISGDMSKADAFHGHMLIEMAQMSLDDGLVMQLHAGSRRNTNHALFDSFGPDKGTDIPVAVDWVRGLEPLLNRVGNDPRLTLILFTLDETSYARELAPMAGHWPCLRIGPPWWFHDSAAGIARYLDQVVETAGYYNLAGFNDDTRAFLSIPARHDLWRRAVSRHLAAQIERGYFDIKTADHMARLLATDLARSTYKLD